MKIRKATLKDIPDLARIEVNSGYKFRNSVKLNEENKRIKRDFKLGKDFFILEGKDKNLAYASLHIKKGCCKLDYLSVLKTHHGKGIGIKFMKFLEDYAKKRKCKIIILKVNNKNFSAISLYNKSGYVIKAIKTEINYDKPVKKLIMEKEV